MLFNIEEDSGDRIIGYAVTDSYSGTARIRISSQGKALAVLSTTNPRPALVAAGRHATGNCGFSITTDVVPDLAQYQDLEIAEEQSGLVFYRRRLPQTTTAIRLFRLETQQIRQTQLDVALGGLFQVAFPAVDQLGQETTTQTFLLDVIDSQYISAHLQYKHYEYSIGEEFRKACLLQDPYIELAETLLILQADPGSLGLREGLALQGAMDFLSEYDLMDDRELRLCLRRMPDAVYDVLSAPLGKQLASKSVNEIPNLSYVSGSFQTLSSFDVVGLREVPQTFSAPLGALLGVDPDLLTVSMPSSEAYEFANRLRTQPFVQPLIDLDDNVYTQVSSAIRGTY